MHEEGRITVDRTREASSAGDHARTQTRTLLTDDGRSATVIGGHAFDHARDDVCDGQGN
jgi:hypothetical protein